MLEYEANRTRYQSLHKTVQHQLLVNECLKASQHPTLAGQAVKMAMMLAKKLGSLFVKNERTLLNRTNTAMH